MAETDRGGQTQKNEIITGCSRCCRIRGHNRESFKGGRFGQAVREAPSGEGTFELRHEV